MIELALAALVFLAAHVLPRAMGWRERLIARFGRRAYGLSYSGLSLAALAWLISATLRAPYVPLWPTSAATAAVPLLLMAPACVLLVSGAGRANPLSVSFRAGEADAASPGILALTRHPVLWAFALWAGSHAIANGDLAALILFGGFFVFALIGMKGMERRARARGERAAFAIARGPLVARLRRAASPRFFLEIAGGLALYALLLALHEPVIGVDPLAWFA